MILRRTSAQRLAAIALCATGLQGCSSSSGQAIDSGHPAGQVPAGGSCSAAADCQSGSCAGGACCTGACGDPAYPSCSYCDSFGTCQFTQAVCRPKSCDPVARQASSAALCAQGSCPLAVVTACAGGCDGEGCGAGCLQDTDCGATAYCFNATATSGGGVDADGGESGGGGDAGGGGDGGPGQLTRPPLGTCLARGAGGAACAHADACSSGVCLGGRCCSQPCTTDPLHPECTSCDGNGACAYPAVTCEPATCDPVTNAYAPEQVCQAGSCVADAGPTACLLQRCNPSAQCDPQAGCLDDQECAANAYCAQALGGQCCALLLPGATIYVDIALGDDQSCCGNTPQTPCKTLTHALELYRLAQQRPGGEALTSITLEARVNRGGGDWASHGQPADRVAAGLALPSGVTLHAPGVYFAIPFAIWGAQVSLLGDPQAPLFLGIDSTGQQPVSPFAEGSAILYFNGFQALDSLGQPAPTTAAGRLRLSNVSLWEGLEMQGEVVLGEDQSGDAGGPVLFGNPQLFAGVSVPAGILIDSPGVCSAGNRSLLRDHSGLANSLQISALGTKATSLPGLLIQDCADVDLEDSPYLGVPLGSPEDGGGAARNGIELGTNSSLTLVGAQIRDTDHAAVLVASGSNSVLRLRNSQLWFNRCAGLELAGGQEIDVSASQLVHNYYNLLVDPSAGALNVDLSHGADGGPGQNVLACSDPGLQVREGNLDSNPLCANNGGQGPGVDLWDLSNAAAVQAAGVAWSHQPPQSTVCDANLAQCHDPRYDVVVAASAAHPNLAAPQPAASCVYQ